MGVVSSPSGGRVVSPENVLDMMGASPHKPYIRDPYHGGAEKRVTIWNKRDKRKLSGNSAPFRKNLAEYCRKHPDWEEYCGQDKDDYVPGVSKPQLTPRASASPAEGRRERESRRTAGRRSVRSEEVLHSAGRRSRRGEEQDADVRNMLSPGASNPQGNFAGQKRPCPADVLSLEDTPFEAQCLPSEEDVKKKRRLWWIQHVAEMTCENQMALGEAEVAKHDGAIDVGQTMKEEKEHQAKVDQALREQKDWEAAKLKCEKIRLEHAQLQQQKQQELSSKRQAEHEEQQLQLIELCEKRLKRFKHKLANQ